MHQGLPAGGLLAPVLLYALFPVCVCITGSPGCRTGRLVVIASGSLSVLPYAAVQKIGIKTCCGVECPCLNLSEFKKENKKAKNKRKTDVDLEVGGESETDRAPSAIRGEGAAPGTGLVNSAPQPQVPMVAAPERARTAMPKPSRHTAADNRGQIHTLKDALGPVGAVRPAHNLGSIHQQHRGARFKVAL